MTHRLNKVAWEMLTHDEKAALTLQLGMGKSTWQSGEVMEKSHYKYLEIKQRGEYFLKIFTEHLNLFDSIIPPNINGNKDVITYFKMCIGERAKPMWALETINKSRKANNLREMTKSQLNDKIIKQLEEWEYSSNAYDNTTFNLIMDFDRWNNFRILPKSIQEPSAYKRRVKNVYKKQIKITMSINTLSLDKLIKQYQTKNKGCWWPFLYNGEPKLIKVKVNNQSWKIFKEVGLYIFDFKEDANEYLEAIHEYVSKPKKECTDGLVFWPIYREKIKKAKNYSDIQQITPSRRYLTMALNKIEFL